MPAIFSRKSGFSQGNQASSEMNAYELDIPCTKINQSYAKVAQIVTALKT
jgi:hypothetical protein